MSEQVAGPMHDPGSHITGRALLSRSYPVLPVLSLWRPQHGPRLESWQEKGKKERLESCGTTASSIFFSLIGQNEDHNVGHRLTTTRRFSSYEPVSNEGSLAQATISHFVL
jgi:hypothetical protein